MSFKKRFLKKTNPPIPYRKVVKTVALYSIVAFVLGAIAFKQYMDKKK